MSRLFEYVQTELFPDQPKELTLGDFTYQMSTLNKIKEQCSDIIKEYDKATSVLWRGSGKSSLIKMDKTGYIYKAYPRDNRYPKDTPQEIHELLDDALYKKFKWRPRSQGVFAGHYSVALGYGVPYVFLPVNGYKYIWSKTINDLYSDFAEDYARADTYDVRNVPGMWVNTEKPDEEVKYLQDIKGYVTHKVSYKKFDRYNWETLVKTKGEHDFEYETLWRFVPSVTEAEWEKEQDQMIDKVVDTYTDKNLYKGMSANKQKEFTFKCDMYYLIRVHPSRVDGLEVHDLGLR
jgi:hypothetical protein